MLITDRIDVTQRKTTPEGFLEVSAVFARTGIQQYTAAQVGATDRDPHEIVNVYRPADEVFSQESLDSFRRKPVTNDHPGGAGRVTADNAKHLQVGMSGDHVARDGELMRGSLTITDGTTIREVEGGKRQVSLGYDCAFLPEAGTHDGVPFEFTQRKIRGNHVAIVDRGRCGPTCSVLDGADCDGECNHDGGDPMKTSNITIGDSEIEVPEAVAKHIAQLTADMEEAKEKAKDMESEKEKAEDEAEEAKKKASEAEAAKDAALDKAVSKDDLQKLIADQAVLIHDAKRLYPGIEPAGKTAAEIRREVVAQVLGADVVKDKDDTYIEVRFDVLTEGGNEAGSFARRNLSARDSKQDERTDSQKAHDAAVDALENRWDRSRKDKPAA
jgi:hypothetical protein